jgi:nicotinamidase-related amidase
METAIRGPDITKSALIVVDMQNDFVHSEGSLACKSREVPEAEIDMPFLMGTIPQVKRLVAAFCQAGRPVVYVAHILKADYSDAQIPYWRL